MTSNRATEQQQKQQRRSAKAFVSQFQDKIRAECAEISKQRRQALLNQHRSAVAHGSSSEELQAELRLVAKERAAQLLQGGGLGGPSPAWTSSAASPASASPSSQPQQQPSFAPASCSHAPGHQTPAASRMWSGLGVDEAGPGEHEPVWSEAEVLQLLEDQLYSSLIAEELELMEREQQMQVEEMAEEYEQQSQAGCSSSDQVLCPVCGRCALVQLHGVVACPLERWQLDLRVESLSLQDLRGRLAGTYESHSCSGCAGSLVFSLGTLFNCSQLQAHCRACSFMHIVI